ncbi:MAG: hypothetical protein NTZ20_05310 [Candidatus Levybacteria bacterium]|nr:hypothetical protein [Candidatus Levybacteria bacterium]
MAHILYYSHTGNAYDRGVLKTIDLMFHGISSKFNVYNNVVSGIFFNITRTVKSKIEYY